MGYRAFFDRYRSFGVELEVYGPGTDAVFMALRASGIAVRATGYTHEITNSWKLVPDGSISGAGGVEVVSPILKGEEGLEEVRKVVAILGEIGCRVNRSCGFHVHWNVADYTGKNVQSLLRLYAKFENVIDFLVSPSRRGDENHYCRTMVKDHDLSWVTRLDPNGRARASEILDRFNQNQGNSREIRRSASRFHKVNITSYGLYGTIEFRQHQGTLNADKIINWILFTQQLVNKSKLVGVSKEVSAKPTLGELLRVLRLPPHPVEYDWPVDSALVGLKGYLKKRYAEFREGLSEEE